MCLQLENTKQRKSSHQSNVMSYLEDMDVLYTTLKKMSTKTTIDREIEVELSSKGKEKSKERRTG